MNTIKTVDSINDLNLSRREEKVLRALVGRAIARRHRGPEISLEGAKGALITAIIIIVGLLLGYLLFLASPKWSAYFPFLDPLSTYLDPFGLLLIFFSVTLGVQVPVRERLIRKLYRALEKKGGSATTAKVGE